MELAEMEMAYAREHRRLGELVGMERRGYSELRREHAREKLDLGVINACFADLQAIQEKIERQAQVLQDLAERARRKRDELIEIAKEKKALEKLKEKHERELAEALARAENKVLQDIATSQFHRRVAAESQSG